MRLLGHGLPANLKRYDATQGQPMGDVLSIKEISKGYSRGDRWIGVLENVSLEIVPGEIVAVTGARLAGKTTLLKVAAGTERPDKGSVSLGGHTLTELDQSRSQPLGRTVRWVDREGPGLKVEASKYVGWPLAVHGAKRKSSEHEAARALERVGAGECAGRQWSDLSEWERVLVGLAQGFVGNPQLVIVDDLLDGLGSRDTERASDLLRSLVEESDPRCGVLMSATDMDSAMFADRVWTITGKHSLKPVSGQLTGEGEIVPFPKPVQADGC